MNLGSENRTENLEANFKSVYCHNEVNNSLPIKFSYNFKSGHQNQDQFKLIYDDEDDLDCDRFRTRSKPVIPPYSYMRSEPRSTLSRASSESIRSRHLCTQAKYPPNEPSYRNIEPKANRMKNDVQQYYDINTNVSVKHSEEQLGGKLNRSHEKLFCNKTTYCRPVLNLYNQEFLYKTLEKDAKLQRLVKQLVTARQREKEKEHWNNYINILRNKHCRDESTKLRRATSIQNISKDFENSENIENYYHTKCMCDQSNLEVNNKVPDDVPSSYEHYKMSNGYHQIPKNYNTFETNALSYPISSQGRYIILERERMKLKSNGGNKPLHTSVNEERRLESENVKYTKCKVFGPTRSSVICNNRGTNTQLENISHAEYTQTDFKILSRKNINLTIDKECNPKHKDSEKACNTSQVKLHCPNKLKQNSIVSIEEKLDKLIHSINNFMIELKTNNVRSNYLEQNAMSKKKNVNYTRSDSFDIARKERNVCGLVDNNSSRTTGYSSEDNISNVQTLNDNLNKINDFFLKGMGKNKLLNLNRSSVRDIYHACSVQISLTIPTKEISTEVTRSLSKAVKFVQTKERDTTVEEIPRREDKRIAIAVNTDPFSLLAMLRVSTEETMKRLLSYVPTIDYYYYLSRLHGPTVTTDECQYVCKICGAAFIKASALTDHIQKHELGYTRDCCVCRHVLDMPRRRAGLFKCQYCGQRFTRAYCCELHQEACARRLGKRHDITSSLMLLR